MWDKKYGPTWKYGNNIAQKQSNRGVVQHLYDIAQEQYSTGMT